MAKAVEKAKTEKICTTGVTWERRKHNFLGVGSGPLKMYFQYSEAKIRVFEQNTDIVKFWLFGVFLLQRKVGGEFT